MFSLAFNVFPGLLLAVASYQFRSMDYLSLKTYLTTSLLLLFIGLLIFLVIQLAGIDPFWSLTLAEKWCQNKDWIHLDTTLFAAIIRDASSLVGAYLSTFKSVHFFFVLLLLVFLLSLLLLLLLKEIGF